MNRSQRMAFGDAAWIGVEQPENRVVVVAVLQLSGWLDIDVLRELVRERIVERHPRLRHRPSASRFPLLGPRWRADDAFDLSSHVVEVTATVADAAALQRLASHLVSTPLDAVRPRWQIHLARLDGGGSALVARFHHSIADGMALARVFLSLADEMPPAPGPARAPATATGRVATAARVAASVVSTTTRLAATVGEPSTSLRGPLQTAKTLAWTRPHDLDDVREVSRARGVSINDVLLAATAGGLRTHLLHVGGAVDDLRAIVPVDLRGGSPVPANLGNRFGVVFVELPVGEPDPAARLQAVAARTQALKGSAQAGATFTLLRVVGALPAAGRWAAVRLLEESASLVVTNVPGPRRPLSLAGCRVDDVVFWVPQIGRIGLGISLFSYAGTVTVGVAVDSALTVDAVRVGRRHRGRDPRPREIAHRGSPRDGPGNENGTPDRLRGLGSRTLGGAQSLRETQLVGTSWSSCTPLPPSGPAKV